MFHVGDKVVYPMHGAGVIEAIEFKEILGQKKEYYVLKFPVGGMKVLVPVKNQHDVGLREIIHPHEYNKVLQVLCGEETRMSDNWNRRYRINLDKIKSGDIFEVADVVRNLMIREREKGLSAGERKMLNSARQILVSELALASGNERAQIEKLIDDMNE